MSECSRVERRILGFDRALASRVKSSSTAALILSLPVEEVWEGRVTRRRGVVGDITRLIGL